MATYEQKKQKALHLLRKVISFTQQLNKKEHTARLEEAAQRLEKSTLMVIVAGEFRRGKSSLLNAFLDIPQKQELFPVDISVTTSLASTIAYGPQEEIHVLLGDGNSDAVQNRSIQRSEIRHYVTEQENPKNKLEARLLQIQYPHEQLHQGLMLVDTPGVGGIYTKHTDITRHFMPNADAVLFVSDVLTPLTEPELCFIKECILPYTEYLFFVLTKIDQIKDYIALLAENRLKLAATLNCAPEALTIIPISSALKSRYLETHDQETLEESHFPELASTLWRFVGAKRGRILIARALTILSEVLSELYRPLQVEYDTYQQENQQELDKLEASLKEAQTTLRQLEMENAQWQSDLYDGLQDITSEVHYQLEAGFAKIQRQALGYITDEVLAEPELVLSPVLGDINNLLYALDKAVETSASRLYEAIRQTTRLDLSKFSPDGLYGRGKSMSAEELIKVPYRIIEQKSIIDDLDKGASHSIASGIFGDIVGFVIGLPFLGTLVRGAVTFFGARKAQKERMQQVRQRDRYQIEVQLQLEIADQQRDLIYKLNKNIQDLRRLMRDDLLQQIRHEKESREQALQAFLAARQRTKAEAAARLLTLRGPLQQAQQLLTETENALVEVANTDDDPPTVRPQPGTDAEPGEDEKEDRGEWADAGE